MKLGPNHKISKVNSLAGKLILQILLTQMCRSGEVAQLKLTCMRLLQGAVQFHLQKPTKTLTVKSITAVRKLQIMTIKKFEGNPLLCPLTTLLAYIDRTKFRRGTVSHLFVLCTTQEPRPATHTTIVRWAKDIMKEAGLGSYKIHSSHSASSTSALLMGMPLDAIITHVGWTKASTFIKYYMKPILNKKDSANRSPHVNSMSKEHGVFNDPYNFTGCVAKNTPRGHCGHDGFEKVEKFKNHHKPKPKQVYGPTPFAPCSPASTVSYCQEPPEMKLCLQLILILSFGRTHLILIKNWRKSKMQN